MKKRLWHLGFFRVPDLAESLITGRERMFLSWFFKQGYYDPSAIGPADIDEYVRAYAGVGALRAGCAFNRSREQSAAQVKAVVLQRGDAYDCATLTATSPRWGKRPHPKAGQ